MKLSLPAHINASGLLPFISLLGRSVRADEEVEVDFSTLRRVSPAALAVFVATVDRWKRDGRAVRFCGLAECGITAYLQRMDVLRHSGVVLPEGFRRHDARGKFVPLQLLDHRVGALGQMMAGCVAPGGDDWDHPASALYEMVWYALTETANNARQHSGGRGFATAQVMGAEGFVRLAIADNGRGILESFREAGLPWSRSLDDPQAIRKSLEPLVSSKGTPTNEGVGLTLLSGLVALTGAWLLIVSGRGWLRIAPKEPITTGVIAEGSHYQGTLIALTFMQRRVQNFAGLLHQAKVNAGLLPPKGGAATFRP